SSDLVPIILMQKIYFLVDLSADFKANFSYWNAQFAFNRSVITSQSPSSSFEISNSEIISLQPLTALCPSTKSVNVSTTVFFDLLKVSATFGHVHLLIHVRYYFLSYLLY